MATTALTVVTLPGPYDTDGVAPGFEAADNANGNHFPATGKEILIVRNDNVAEQTVTVTSVADEKGRTGDISADAIPAGEYRIYQQFPTVGWKDGDGNIVVTASAADVYLAVVKLP